MSELLNPDHDTNLVAATVPEIEIDPYTGRRYSPYHLRIALSWISMPTLAEQLCRKPTPRCDARGVQIASASAQAYLDAHHLMPRLGGTRHIDDSCRA